MLKISNLGMRYNSNIILNNITYEFNKNKIYGLIGKNGAGKTTLLKIIMRLITTNTGTIYLNNQNLYNVDYLNMDSTFIGDSPIFYSNLTVFEQMLLVCKIENFSKEDALNKITTILEKLKLTEYKNYYTDALSKGTLQRVNVAFGLLRKPNLILMDEPFTALDPVQVKTLEGLILEYKKLNKTFIISSHDIDSLQNICDLYLILKDGKLLEYKPNELNKENIADLIGDSYGE